MYIYIYIYIYNKYVCVAQVIAYHVLIWQHHVATCEVQQSTATVVAAIGRTAADVSTATATSAAVCSGS